MTPVLNGKGLVLEGLTFKNRGQLGSRYIIYGMHIGSQITKATSYSVPTVGFHWRTNAPLSTALATKNILTSVLYTQIDKPN